MQNETKYRKAERIGRMNAKMQVHYAVQTLNAYGEREESWSSLGTFWTRVEYGSEKEQPQSGQNTVMSEVRFWLRNTNQINETQRVYFNSRLYDIEGITITDDRQYMQLLCKQYDTGSLSVPQGGATVGNMAYLQEFTNTTGTTFTVTVYGGNIPTNKAQVFVKFNGSEIQNYSIAGNQIILDFSITEFDVLTVRFIP
jgi:SPP1 family predicted phage head-tail adaptor